MNYKPLEDEIEKVVLVECLEFPGFYYYPENEDIIVNHKGECKKISTNHTLSFYNVEGSYRINNLTVDKKLRKSISQHRVLARTFIGRPKRHWDKSFNELQVNHKDGNKRNNKLENLEWVTYTENRNHAYETGLHTTILKVLSKNILTNEIICFRNISECANFYKINVQTLISHLNSKHIGKRIKNNYVFKFDNDLIWPIISSKEIEKLGDKYKSVLAKNILTNEIIKFNSITECTRKFKLSKDVLKDHLKSNSSGKYYKNNHVFKYDNSIPWKEYHPIEMRELGKKGVPVIVKNTETNMIIIYESYVEAAKENDIDFRLLKYHLRKKSEYVNGIFKFSKLL